MRQIGSVADPRRRRHIEAPADAGDYRPVAAAEVVERVPSLVEITQPVPRTLQPRRRFKKLTALQAHVAISLDAEVLAHVGDEMVTHLEHQMRLPVGATLD